MPSPKTLAPGKKKPPVTTTYTLVTAGADAIKTQAGDALTVRY